MDNMTTTWICLAIATGIILVICGTKTSRQRKSTKADVKGDACPKTWYTWAPVIVGGLILAIALGTAFVKVGGAAGGNGGSSGGAFTGEPVAKTGAQPYRGS